MNEWVKISSDTGNHIKIITLVNWHSWTIELASECSHHCFLMDCQQIFSYIFSHTCKEMNGAKNEGKLVMYILDSRVLGLLLCISEGQYLIRGLFQYSFIWEILLQMLTDFYKVALSFSKICITTNTFPSATLMKWPTTRIVPCGGLHLRNLWIRIPERPRKHTTL